ncbi:MAG: hypothetical protein MJ065_06035 [Oscillospiraceae bacterium]|nr:hypothetical protein [Oscillospiraceae bacterium]
MNRDSFSEVLRNEQTEHIYDAACFGAPINPQSAGEITDGIARALELDAYPFFLVGLAEKLTQLGTACTAADTEIMLAEIKRRYRTKIGKSCPRTVQEWIKGQTPGVTSRQNHYELCYALEMDHQQTAAFFQKHFLTLPFNVKAKEDAVFFYCLFNRKPYAAAAKMLAEARCYVSQDNAHTATAQIMAAITQQNDDAAFLRYLSVHCYDNAQQFQLARQKINTEIEQVKEHIKKFQPDTILSPDRLNSATIAELLGYRYQSREKDETLDKLPKRFRESLPNDVTLGRIINGDTASYELLRKTLMLLHFYNFFDDADNEDRNTVAQNLMDFYDELDALLLSCGFAQLYVRHPFDCLLLRCANSYEPIVTLYSVLEYGRN